MTKPGPEVAPRPSHITPCMLGLMSYYSLEHTSFPFLSFFKLVSSPLPLCTAVDERFKSYSTPSTCLMFTLLFCLHWPWSKYFSAITSSRFPCVTCPVVPSFISLLLYLAHLFSALFSSSFRQILLLLVPCSSCCLLAPVIISRWKEICLKHYSTYQSADNPLSYSLRWKHWHRTAISVRVKTIKSSLVNNILFFVAKLGFGALLLKKKKKQFSKFSRIFPCAVYAARCVGEDLYVKVFRMLHREYSPVKKRKKNRCWELNFYISQGVLQICLSLSPGSEWQKLPTPALQSNCCSPNCCTQNEGVFSS